MSEVVVTGAAAVAAGSCLAIAALVAGGVYLAYKGLAWLSKQGEREMERLEMELAEPLKQATPREAHEQFRRNLCLARSRAAKNPILKDHAEAVARILAFRNSSLSAFITRDEAKTLTRPVIGKRNMERISKIAELRFSEASAEYLSKSVCEVGREVGFSFGIEKCRGRNRQTMVLQDNEGRALVAQVKQCQEGPKVNLDLVGFGGGACHNVMDRILDGLSRREISFRDMARKSHYRREGVLSGTTTQAGVNGSQVQKQGFRFAASNAADSDLARRRRLLDKQTQIR